MIWALAVAKLDLTLAQVFLNEGGYYLNSGIFLFRRDVLLATFQLFARSLLSLFLNNVQPEKPLWAY